METPGASSQAATDRAEAGGDIGTVNSAEIMARIRAAIARRRAEAGLSEQAFDALATGAPGQPAPDDLRRDIERLADALRYSGVEMLLSDTRPSPISGVIQRLRAALHEVILFYVNRHAAQQAAVNRMTLRALRTALALIEAQQAEIERLKEGRRG